MQQELEVRNVGLKPFALSVFVPWKTKVIPQLLFFIRICEVHFLKQEYSSNKFLREDLYDLIRILSDHPVK